MKIGVIVLNYNDYESTINYVNTIKNYDIIDKIIIVDNDSTNKDEIRKLKEIKNDKVDIISSQKNGGYAYGNNIGLRYLEKIGNYKYVAISNPDVYVDEETLKKCIDYLEKNNKAGIVAPRMHFVNGVARRSAWKKRTPLIDIASSTRLTEILLFPFFKQGEYSKKDFKEDDLKVDCIAGSFFIAKMDALKKINFLDTNTFLFYEEDIIGDKFKKEGYEIHSLNNLKFIHYDSKTIGKVMSMYKKMDLLFDSKIYYQKEYNKINGIQKCIFQILRIIRKIELVFEIPIVKFVNVIKSKK